MANFAFSALLLSLAGWAALEAALLTVGAATGFHILACAPGLILTAISFRRCRVWWPSFANAGASEQRALADRAGVDVIGCVALITAGVILALSTKTGSLMPVIASAGIISFVPWSRMSFSGRHYYLAYALVAIGATPVLYIWRSSSDIFFYFLCAWVFWSIAGSELLVLLVQDRKREARPDAIEKTASPIVGHNATPQLDKLGERP